MYVSPCLVGKSRLVLVINLQLRMLARTVHKGQERPYMEAICSKNGKQGQFICCNCGHKAEHGERNEPFDRIISADLCTGGTDATPRIFYAFLCYLISSEGRSCCFPYFGRTRRRYRHTRELQIGKLGVSRRTRNFSTPALLTVDLYPGGGRDRLADVVVGGLARKGGVLVVPP